MRLKIHLSIIAVCSQLLICAQSGVKFENNNMVGLLSGSTGTAGQLQTINGISYKTFSLGIGVGIDNYYFKTIPLFADLRKNIFNTRQTPFVYLDAGTNFPGKKDEVTTWQTTSYGPGFYYDFGLGYIWTLGKRFNINSSFGFSQKRYSSKEEYHYGGDVTVTPDSYDYRLQRFTLKFGLGF